MSDYQTYRGKSPSEWIENGKQPDVCDRCDGCGEVADSDDAEAWWTWKTLPVPSNFAVMIGAVKPVPCPECGGTGTDLAPVTGEGER